jgi:hypothetical protein
MRENMDLRGLTLLAPSRWPLRSQIDQELPYIGASWSLRIHRLFCVDTALNVLLFGSIGKVTSATYKAFAYSVAKSTTMKMFKEECIAFAFLDMGIAASCKDISVYFTKYATITVGLLYRPAAMNVYIEITRVHRCIHRHG